MATIIQTKLGNFTLPATPKPADNLTMYQQAVSVWTKQAQQTLKQFQSTLIGLDLTQIPVGNSPLPTLPLVFGNLTETTSSVLTIVGGTGAVIGSGLTIAVTQASGVSSGYLSSADWTTFNGKQDALTFPLSAALGGTGADLSLSAGILAIVTGVVFPITVLSPLDFAGGFLGVGVGFADDTSLGVVTFVSTDFNDNGLGLISLDYDNGQKATASVPGFLTSTDWTTFNSKQPALGFTPLDASKSTHSAVLCLAFTPTATGADVGEFSIPYATDGTTSLTYTVTRITLRVNVAGGAPAITIEKSTASGAFSASSVGTVTLGSGAYEGSVTAALGTVASGDKIRFNVGTLATATGWTVSIEVAPI